MVFAMMRGQSSCQTPTSYLRPASRHTTVEPATARMVCSLSERSAGNNVLFCLSWKWRERSAVKITERTHEKDEETLLSRREGSHSEATFAGPGADLEAVR